MSEKALGSNGSNPLATCLVLLARMHNRSYSVESLITGLPLKCNHLTAELFCRAAERAGFLSKLVDRDLSQISPDVLPSVLPLKENRAVILLEFMEEEKVKLLLPEGEGKEVIIAIKELKELYDGKCILMKPLPEMDQREQDFIHLADKPFSWFWKILFRNKRIYADVALAAVLINIFVTASPLYVMNVYDRVIPNEATETLWVLAVGISIVYLFDWLLKILRAYLIDIAGKRSDIMLSNLIFEHIMNIKMSERPKSTGAFANLVRDFESVRDFFTSATLVTFIDVPFVFLFIGIIHMIGGPLAMVLLAGVVMILLINYLVQEPLAKAINADLKGSGNKHGLLVESLGNLEQIKVMNGQGLQQKRWEECVGVLSHWSVKSKFFSSLALYSTMWIQQMVTVILVIVGVYLIIEGTLSQGALIACVILSGRAIAPMGQMASLGIRYQRAKQGLEGIKKLMEMPVERDMKKKTNALPKLKGDIEFRDVSFAYQEDQEPVLQGVSFKIKAGERVGIIGKVGSGKSTCLKMILGLFEATQGKILLDGIVHKQYDLTDIRYSMGYIPQDSKLFFGSLHENIMMASPKKDENIRRAMEVSGLSDLVNNHPQGINLHIGENGEGISIGQAQMVAIARGLVNEVPIYLFDEPTSSLDHNTETVVLNRLHNFLNGQTLILVSHKLPLLALVDRLLLFDEGKLVLDGPKAEVIGRLTQNEKNTEQSDRS